MEQRIKEMGKKSAGVYRSFINSMKKENKERSK